MADRQCMYIKHTACLISQSSPKKLQLQASNHYSQVKTTTYLPTNQGEVLRFEESALRVEDINTMKVIVNLDMYF